ncbi:MAG: hypothetical protein IJT25_03085 [Clostridia bacterium]|nr:hypothetical protein [Clostridia bacterium]
MNYKRFGLLSLILSVIIIISVISLVFIKTDTNGEKLNIGEPSSFIYYDSSITGTTIDKTSAKFESVYSEVKNMTKLSVFSRLVSGGSLNESPREEISSKIESGYSSSQMKTENTCLEICFDTKQTQIVETNGNRHVIEFYSLIFVISKSGTREVAIYFDTKNVSTHTYEGLPFYVRANTESLNKAVLA